MILARNIILVASLMLLSSTSKLEGTGEVRSDLSQVGHPILVESLTIDTLFFGMSVKETWKIWNSTLRRWEYKTRVRWG